MEIKNSIAVVTGAAKRVGKTIALALAKKGAHIVLHYNRSAAEAFDTQKLLEKEGVQVFCIQADLSSVKEIEHFITEARSKAGKIDILVNSASQFNETPFDTVSESDWDTHLNVNLKGVFFLSQFAAQFMREQKKGKIINIIDSHISHPYTNYVPYLVSKSGLVGLTYCLAKELAPYIQVNAISPGPVLTQPTWGPEMIQAITASVPLQRIGRPEDVAQGVLFCIEGTDFMTGAIIPIDGGQRLR